MMERNQRRDRFRRRKTEAKRDKILDGKGREEGSVEIAPPKQLQQRYQIITPLTCDDRRTNNEMRQRNDAQRTRYFQ